MESKFKKTGAWYIARFLFSVKSAILFLSLLAISMAIGTFVENDYGTEEARIWIYNAWWFEFIFGYLVCIFIYNIFYFKLLRLSKLPVLLLHTSFIIILIGAGITRYSSQEGIMKIYENEEGNMALYGTKSVNKFFSIDKYFHLKFGVNGDYKFEFKIEEPLKLNLSQHPPSTWWFPNLPFYPDPNYFEINHRIENKEIKFTYHDFYADFENTHNTQKQFVFLDTIIKNDKYVIQFMEDGVIYELIQDEPKEINEVFFNFSSKSSKSSNSIIYGTFKSALIKLGIKSSKSSKSPPNKMVMDIFFNESDSLFFKSNLDIFQSNMMEKRFTETLSKHSIHKLKFKKKEPGIRPPLYKVDYLHKKHNFDSIPYSKNDPELADLLKIKVSYANNGDLFDTVIDIFESGFSTKNEQYFALGLNQEFQAKASFGPKIVELPFDLYLEDFQLDYYPSTNSPASFASEVIVDMNKSSEKKFRIFMNNILNHKGYRFYQSSYGEDEYGEYTVLSVNQDFWGTTITYLGYSILVLSILSVLFYRRTRFNFLLNKLKKMTNKLTILIFLLFLFNSCGKQKNTSDIDNLYQKLDNINPNQPDLFNDVLISPTQEDETKGRIRPFHTRSSELLRKIYGKTNISYIDSEGNKEKINSNQAIISMMLYPEDWRKVPIIKLGKHEKIKNLFNIDADDKYISYNQLFAWDTILVIQFPFEGMDRKILPNNSETILYDNNFGFNSPKENDINIFYKNGKLEFSSKYDFTYLTLLGHESNYGKQGILKSDSLHNLSELEKEKVVLYNYNNNDTLAFRVIPIALPKKDTLISIYNNSFAKKPHLRSTYDKEVISLQERRYIFESIISSIQDTTQNNPYNSPMHLNFFPPDVSHISDVKQKKNILDETSWVLDKKMSTEIDSLYNKKTFFLLYKYYIEKEEFSKAALLVDELKKYQRNNADLIIPSEKRISSEIFYNKVNPFHFSRLVFIYLFLGLLLLIFLFIQLFSPQSTWLKYSIKALKIGIYFSFIFHLFFLALRWYISSHAPWSDAYESIIYISFATVFSGIVFGRNSNFALSGSVIVASIFLMVANLNWINPEITNLAPVLNSYWLMIHVSVITSSYGFLALSAFLGILSLLFIIFSTRYNLIKQEISRLVSINERCMMIGLFLLTIGTFLGGVWANESWGRYWGWDPKETWALISVVIYSIVLHIRFLSSKRFIYFFSLFSILAFYSIIMTYFGVNFYLSGLHSYAQGDPGPIPSFLPISFGLIFILSLVSYFRYKYVFLNKKIN